MSHRVFALIVGIDQYKSGSIWNLESATSDAKAMRHWLSHHLDVPRSQIRTLLDSEATKSNIEEAFTSHLINNPAIEHGDVILIYWAGHGTSIHAPKSWSSSSSAVGYGQVEMLVTYDHDTKSPSGSGRISGISDRSMFTMMQALSKAKGDNITFTLDASFSSPVNSRERGSVRWTPTTKASAEDVVAGMWGGAVTSAGEGFFHADLDTHVLLAASGPRESAMEGNDGGRFTQALIKAAAALPLHQTSYADLISYINSSNSSFDENHHQTPRSFGQHKSRIVFHSLPFVTDERYIAIDAHHGAPDHFRIEVGSEHGVVRGMELSMHKHNRRGSLNPSLDSLRVLEVHPTWSLARRRTREGVQGEWAQITQKTSFKSPKAYLKRHMPFGHQIGTWDRSIRV